MRRDLAVVGLGILSLAAVSLLYQKPLILNVILVLIAAATLYLRKSSVDYLLFVTVAVSGPAAEAIAISFGAWSYAMPRIVGVPYWLFTLWGIAAVYIHTKVEVIDGLLDKDLQEYLEG